MGLGKNSITLDPRRKKKYFFPGLGTTMMHGTLKLLFGITLMYNEKHVDPI